MRRLLLTLLVLAFTVSSQAVGDPIPGLTFTTIPIAQPRTVNPFSLGRGSNGRVWFADWVFTQVGFISPSGAITAFKLADSADPLNLVRPLSIVEGPDGNAWFTFYVTNSSGTPIPRTGIGRVTPSGSVTMFPVASADGCRLFSNRRTCGITVGPDGNLWFLLSQSKRFGRITPSGQIAEFAFPGITSIGIETIASGADGNLWAADLSGATIYRIATSGQVTPIAIPAFSGLSAPTSVVAHSDGNIWFANFGALGRITSSGAVTYFAVPGQGRANRLLSGPDGLIYYSRADGLIGQLDPATGTVRESPTLNGFVPFELELGATVSQAKTRDEQAPSGEFKIIMNGLPPGGTDYDLQQATVRYVLPEKLILSKFICESSFSICRSIGLSQALVDFSVLEKTALRETRAREGIAVLFLITNDGINLTSLTGYSIEDRLPDCLQPTLDGDVRPCSLIGRTITCEKPNTFIRPGESLPIYFELLAGNQAATCINDASLKRDGVTVSTATAKVIIDGAREDGALRLLDPPIVRSPGRN